MEGVDDRRARSVGGAALDERVLETLAVDSRHVAFNGLRRALEAHPESLSRSLQRLRRTGEIGKDRHGYFLLGPRPAAAPSARAAGLAEVRLPAPMASESVLGALAGRWFGRLRWVGTYDGRRPPGLVWALPGVDGAIVLQVRAGRLRVTAEGFGGSAPPRELVAAGAELLAHALARLQELGPELGSGSPADRSGPARRLAEQGGAGATGGWGS